MKKFVVKSMQDLEDFFKSNEKLNFNYSCQRSGDDYSLRIEAFSKEVNNLAMLVLEHPHSYAEINMHIDSQKFCEAYDGLDENEKIPAHYGFQNPAAHEKFMQILVEVSGKELLNHLKAFNGKKDDYAMLARLAVRKRGSIQGVMTL